MNNLADPLLSFCPRLLTHISKPGSPFWRLGLSLFFGCFHPSVYAERGRPLRAKENQKLPYFQAISATFLRPPPSFDDRHPVRNGSAAIRHGMLPKSCHVRRFSASINQQYQ
jgi:hypothetical protein